MPENYKYKVPVRKWKRSRGVQMLSRLTRQDSLALAYMGDVFVHSDGRAVLTKGGQKNLRYFKARYIKKHGKLPKV